MNLQMDYGQRRLINVVGKITGAVAPDEWIIVGSHRDAWTFGASDSVSGHVSMMAVARAMSEMMKKGWKPRRSVLFISWDGEEQGLLGSTEWVEDLTAELKAKAAVYVNRDAGAGGLNFCEQRGALADAVRPRAGAVDSAGGRDQDAVRRLARAIARGSRRRATASRAEDAAGRRARIGIRLHRVSRSRRHRLDGHGAERPRRRRQLSLDLRQPDLVQEVHRSAVRVQRARDAGHRRGAAAARRRRGAAVRLREPTARRSSSTSARSSSRRSKASADGAKKIDFAGLRAAAEAFAKAGADVRARGESMLASSASAPGSGGDQPPADHGRARS